MRDPSFNQRQLFSNLERNILRPPAGVHQGARTPTFVYQIILKRAHSAPTCIISRTNTCSPRLACFSPRIIPLSCAYLVLGLDRYTGYILRRYSIRRTVHLQRKFRHHCHLSIFNLVHCRSKIFGP